MELYIVLAIMAFMIVGFLLNKWPFGLTTMTCCVLLALTGVFTIPEAFAGFCNKTLILLVGMFGMVSAFQKTSVVDKIQAQMLRLKGKSGMALVIGLYVVVIGLACLIIGETVLGRRTVTKGVLAVMIGSVIYRFIYAVVFYTKVVPVECLKLLTAVIVALAIAAPSIRKWAAFQQRKLAAGKGGN